MGLHYLTFVGRNLENRKNLIMVQIMNSASFNSKNILNSVGMFNDIDIINNKFME